MINLMGTSIETAVLDYIREADSDLAQRIMDNMFTFDDLMQVDDRGIQALLKEVQSESLVIALKGAKPELREKIFKNMSSAPPRRCKEELEARGPVRVAEVEAEQKEILKIVRRLAEEGEIVIGGAMTTNSSSRAAHVPPPAGARHGRAKASIYTRFIPREELSAFAAWSPGDLSGAGPGGSAARGRRAAAGIDPAEQHAQQIRAGAPVRLPGRLPRRSGRARRIQAELRAPDDAAGRRAAALARRAARRAAAGDGAALAATATRSRARRCAANCRRAPSWSRGRAAGARHAGAERPPHHAARPSRRPRARRRRRRRAARRARRAPGRRPTIARGGCRVESDIGVIDASIETRWRRAAASLGSDDAVADAGRVVRRRRGPDVVTGSPRAAARRPLGRRPVAALPRRHGSLRRRPGAARGPGAAGPRHRPRPRGGRHPRAGRLGLRDPHAAASAPVIAEVVGFSGDRAYLMPTGDVHGLASGARVVPRPSPAVRDEARRARHPWRRTVDRTLHLPVGDGLLGRVVDSHGHADGPQGPDRRRCTTSR